MASGLYIMRLDADDWLVPEAVEKLVSALKKIREQGLYLVIILKWMRKVF